MNSNLIDNKSSQSSNEIYIDANKIPDLDEHSLDFLSHIVKNDLRFLEFDDNLTIFSLSHLQIGNFFVSVHPFVYRRENCFKVLAKSFGLLDDAPCGTEISALINENLSTIEQDYYEYITLPTGKLERKVQLSLDNQTGEYTITKKENDQKEIKKTTIKVKKSLMSGYISECSNILLQRLMVQSNRLEEICLFTFDSDLNPSRVSYRALDSRLINVSGEEIKVQGMERRIESISDIPTTWQIYFSSDGHMMNRVQIGYPAIMKAVEKPPTIEIDEYLPNIIIPKKELNWEEDVQMKSKHLDRKEELKNDYDQYLKDRPEIKSLMADFMQSVLVAKPNDVVAFSAKYFASYSTSTNSNRALPEYFQKINTPRHF